MPDPLKDVCAIMTVYPIANGFLLHIEAVPGPEFGSIVVEAAQVLYAKDEVGIAGEIVAAQARLKLAGKPAQMELPFETDAKSLATETVKSFSQKYDKAVLDARHEKPIIKFDPKIT